MAVDPQRLRDELSEMRKLIEKDPETKARFDADGNGHIDGDEWEQVRALVTARLEREADEQGEAQRLAEDGAALAAGAVGGVAQQIYEQDLVAQQHGAVGNSISDASVVVLEQQGGLSQIFEGMVRRNYAILGADGVVLGTVEQVESEIMKDWNKGIFDARELSFRLTDAATTETYTLQRSESLGSDQLFVYDDSHGQVGHVRWKPGLLRSEYWVASSFDAGRLIVKTQLLRPFSLEILGVVGNTIGAIERGWSGLGAFVTGANRMRIRLDEPEQASPTHRLGLIATALVADLQAEDDD